VDLGPDARPAEFWTLRASKPGPAGLEQFVSIAYAWSASGDWKAPGGDTRVEFARYPFLYKMYLTRELAPASGRGRDATRGDDAIDPALLRRLVPELWRALFASRQRGTPARDVTPASP
jgi:hypothetical protein